MVQKIKGKQWFFGIWAEPDGAAKKYLDEVHEIQAGRDPRKTGVVQVSFTESTVADPRDQLHAGARPYFQ